MKLRFLLAWAACEAAIRKLIEIHGLNNARITATSDRHSAKPKAENGHSLWRDRVSRLSCRLPPLLHVLDNRMNTIWRCAQFDRPCDVFSRQFILT